MITIYLYISYQRNVNVYRTIKNGWNSVYIFYYTFFLSQRDLFWTPTVFLTRDSKRIKSSAIINTRLDQRIHTYIYTKVNILFSFLNNYKNEAILIAFENAFNLDGIGSVVQLIIVFPIGDLQSLFPEIWIVDYIISCARV